MTETIHVNPEIQQPEQGGFVGALREYVDARRELRELNKHSSLYDAGSDLDQARSARIGELKQQKAELVNFPGFKLPSTSKEVLDTVKDTITTGAEITKERASKLAHVAGGVGSVAVSGAVSVGDGLKRTFDRIPWHKLRKYSLRTIGATVLISLGAAYLPSTSPTENANANRVESVTTSSDSEIIPEALPASVSSVPETTLQPEVARVVIPEYSVVPGGVSAVMNVPAFCDEEITVIENDGTPEDRNIKLDEILMDQFPQEGCEDGDRHAAEITKTEPKYVGREVNKGRKSDAFANTGRPLATDEGFSIETTSEMLPIATGSVGEGQSMFGMPGYRIVSGHRSTQSAPFSMIENFKQGDLVSVKRSDGVLLTYTYRNTVRFEVPKESTLNKDQIKWLEAVVEGVIRDDNAQNASALVLSACGQFGSNKFRIMPVLTLTSATLANGTPVSPTQVA